MKIYMNKTILTKENYAINHGYLSYSTLSKFLRCEAAANARFKTAPTPSLLVGSYVDAYFSNEMDLFKTEHPEIFNSKTGELKADFKKADEIIKRIESDEELMYYLSGEKQVIMTGEIDGVDFKIKMDSYKENEFICDLKIMKDFNRVWSESFQRYTSFVQAYDYDIELAIFQEIVRQNTGKQLPCIIAAVTKEEPSDVGLFQIPQSELDIALKVVKNNLPRIKKILDKKTAPYRCEKCAYCRLTKKARLMDSEYIGLSGDKLRENGFECVDPIN